MKDPLFSKGPWRFRKEHGLPGFVEAPKANGMAYGLDVCGDDYVGYGEEEQREINMRYISALPEYDAACRAILCDVIDIPKARELARAAIKKAES